MSSSSLGTTWGSNRTSLNRLYDIAETPAGDQAEDYPILVDSRLSFSSSALHGYVHLKEISVDFMKRRPKSDLKLVFKDKDDTGVKHKSNKFKKGDLVLWNFDMYVRSHSSVTLTIQLLRTLFEIRIGEMSVEFNISEFVLDDSAVGLELEDTKYHTTVNLVYGRSRSIEDVARVLGFQAGTDLWSTVPRSLKLPQLAALPPPTSERGLGYNVPNHAIHWHWLNDDILLGIFTCYRLDNQPHWNSRLLWCKLSHVCQRWRHLIHESAFHLGMHIECINGSPIVEALEHLPPLPLFISYTIMILPTEETELRIYQALRLRGRVRHIELELPHSILQQVVVLMDNHFPILEHLSLSFPFYPINIETKLPLTLPKAFLAPNLRHLSLPDVSPPRRLRMLTSTLSLVTLELCNIQSSSYFRPRLLVARLSCLPQLEELFISFSTPIPRPSTERKLIGENGAPVTLPSLRSFRFQGVGAYLESLAAQIRAPLLELLDVTLFYQIAFALPHFFYLIKTFELSDAAVHFDRNMVYITTVHHDRGLDRPDNRPFHLCVLCDQLDWQIDCAAQLFHALTIPALSGVEKLTLYHNDQAIPTEFRNGAIDSATWHDLLRSFIGVQRLYIDDALLEELSRALQVYEVGSDPEFLPNLLSIHAGDNVFTTFIDTRQVAGRPVQFVEWYHLRSPQTSTHVSVVTLEQ